MEGAIQIHETPGGFEFDTLPEKVREYVMKHPGYRDYLPKSSDLREGKFLLGTVHDLSREQVKLLRDSLIEEFQPEDAADYMLIDFAVSNYFRCMYATRMEMNCLMYADDYSIEMFEVAADGLQPYIDACQTQTLRVIRALKTTKRPTPSSGSFTYETYSKTQINVEKWGLPLLFALAEITEKKEEQIDIDEIKQVMTKYYADGGTQNVPNSWIGYALGSYGFTDRIHTVQGNCYNISREKVLNLLSQVMKG
jgi:hypothetical protein